MMHGWNLHFIYLFIYMYSFAMSCFPAALVPTVSERTGFSVQQASREKGHALFLLIQTLYFLSDALSFMTGLVAVLIKKNKCICICVGTKGLGIDEVCEKKIVRWFPPTFQTELLL